jgi:L-aspartate oxidase
VAQKVKGERWDLLPEADVPPWKSTRIIEDDELVVLNHTWDEIRRIMWNYVGIVRSEKRLQRAFDKISAIRRELQTYYWYHQIDLSLLEVRNLADVAFLTIQCAMKRKESRGIHYVIDYPHPRSDHPPVDTVLW